LRRKCLLKHVTEGKIEGRIEMSRQGRRLEKLPDELKKKTGYCKLKEEALGHTMWKTSCNRGYGPVVRQTSELING
jgi:hypothetical protein